MGTNAWSRRTGSIGYDWHRQVVDKHIQPVRVVDDPVAHSGATIWLRELSKS
jgi:hypothetical protein